MLSAMRMNFLYFATLAFVLATTSSEANPWKVQTGSTLLDGTETATYVAGYMFTGKDDYEFTSAQISLRCVQRELEMNIVGDSNLLTREEAQSSPRVEVLFKVGDELAAHEATVEYVEWSTDLTRARIHAGPELIEFFRKHDGGSAQVQLPVAMTGVPEVRTLSLESVVEVTDLILATCGPINAWRPNNIRPPGPMATPEGTSEQPEVSLEDMVAIGMAKQVVETLIRDQNVSLEDIVEALSTLTID